MFSVSMAPEAAANSGPRDWIPGDIVAAQVLYCTKHTVFCQVGQTSAHMHVNRCRISRLRHCDEAFSPGDRLFAAVLGSEDCQLVLSGREVLGTWEENAAKFRQGQIVTGTVRSVLRYGIFVELLPNLCGLAEFREGLAPGDGVRVYIRAILPQKHKLKLEIRQVLPQPPAPGIPEYFITSGHIRRWEYYPGSKAVTVF